MKVSQDLSILFYLRYDTLNPNGKATICVRMTVTGLPKDGFSICYQVDPSRFDKKASAVIGRSAEVIEINNQIQPNKMITHVTTNLNSQELEEVYGNRLRSRMRAMFNLIAFSCESADKRQWKRMCFDNEKFNE